MFNLGYLFYIPKKKKIKKSLSDSDIENNFFEFKNKYSRTFSDYLTLKQKKNIKYIIPQINSTIKRNFCLNCNKIMFDTDNNFCNKDCLSTYKIKNLEEE